MPTMDAAPDLIALRDSAFGLDADSLEALIAGEPRLAPDSAVAAEMRGILAYKRRNLEEALPLLSRAAADETHRPHRNSRLFLMRGSFGQGDMAAALVHARAALEQGGDAIEPTRVIARAHLREKAWEAAEAAFARLESLAPDDQETIAQRMRIAAQRGDFEAQIQQADRLLERTPDDPEALRMAVDGRVRARRFDGVERLLPALAKVDPASVQRRLMALRGVEHAVTKARAVRNLIAAGFVGGGGGVGDVTMAELAADQAALWLSAAMRLEAAHDDRKAAELLRAVRIVKPDDRDANDYLEQLADGPVRVMRGAIRARDEEGIVKAAERVLGIDPEIIEAWSALGRAALKSDPPRAIAAFAAAAELAPEDPFIRLNLARAFANAERPADAMVAFADAVTRCGEAEAGWREEAERGIASARRKLIGQAREHLRDHQPRLAWEALRRSGGAGEPELANLGIAIRRGWLAAVRSSFAELEPERVGEANAYLEAAPDDRAVMLLLAREYMVRRQPREALLLWRRLAAIEPAHASHRLQAARCLMSLRLPDEAAREARAALDLDPELADARRLLEQATMPAAAPAA